MKDKQIAITLEQVIDEETTQNFDQRHPGGGPVTDVKEVGRHYNITRMRNAAVIDWETGSFKNRKLRVGDSLTETEADEIARCKVFDVTVTR